ncbi:MAG: acyl-CoA dehydrogenase family protein [Dehalococcoidales bacterium]|nr:acyl-CoA dehydrogenase family protein [Dehalococcoidales bacterium]
MDFSLGYTPEQEKFAVDVKEWLNNSVPKGLLTIRDPAKMSREQWQMRRDFVYKLGQKGWLYPGAPPEYSGGGLNADQCYVLSVELAERGLGLPPLYDVGVLAGPAILAAGTEEQKKRFLPPMFRGEVLTWQLFTEPEAGTDEANQQTNALRSPNENDYFIINGQKIFVGAFPSKPDQFFLLTRSDLQAPRHKNLAAFIVPANLPGIEVQPLDLFPPGTFYEACSPTVANSEGTKHSVFFDDVKVSEKCLIGGDHDGWKVVVAALDVEHSGNFVGVIGRNYTTEKFFAQVKNNPNIIKRIKDNPLLLDTLVDIYIDAQTERLFSIRNSWQSFNHIEAPYTGPQMALFSKNFGGRFIRDSLEVLGPYALTDDTKWQMDDGTFESVQRAGVCFASGGTPEALKINMARALGIGR